MRSDIVLTDLMLDTENPRIEEQPSHRDAVRELFKADPKRMVRLAEDIVQHGTLNPLEKIGVAASEQHKGRYIVHEGNRRIAALLALGAPEIISGAVDAPTEKQVRALSTTYLKGSPAQTVECEVLTFEELQHWITLRHTGSNGGAGIVEWNPMEKQRYLSRSSGRKAIEVQFLDQYLEQTGRSEEEKKRVKKVPTSSLKRLLESSAVRDKFGIAVNDKGWASSDYPEEEMFKWLRRVVHDLSSGRVKVKDIYTVSDIRRYLDTFADSDRPDKRTALKQPIPVDPVSGDITPQVARQERRKKQKAWSLRDAKIVPKQVRLADIMGELTGVQFEKANVHGVMLRVFLELSVDDYISRHHLKVPPDRGNQTFLKTRVLAVVAHGETKGWLDKKQVMATRKIVGSKDLQSTQTLSDYVHNENLHPTPSDVIGMWKNLAVFLAQLHAH